MNTDISVLMPDKSGSEKFAHDNSTKAPEGAMAGAGTGLAIGGVAGGLVGLGIPEYEAKRYASYINDGGTLLSVHTGSSEMVDKAKKVLEQTGAKDISTSGEVTGDRMKTTKIETERARL